MNATNLLTEPMLSVAGGSGQKLQLDLPGVLARLTSGGITEFSRLRPHQQHAWHALLVQLAALALQREQEATGEEPREMTPDAWRRRLRALTPAWAEDEPWCLVVEDLSKPALFQIPIAAATLADWQLETTPDALDVLITVRNHDLKMQPMRQPLLEHWLYALVTLQTTQGYSGRANYGIARMNGGLGNRPCFAASADLSWASRFQHDVAAWRQARAALLGRDYPYAAEGQALLWLLPWEGTTSLPLSALDPFFLDLCRRVRLQAIGTRLQAWTRGSDVARIDAETTQGVTGDAWTPINREDKKSLTIPGDGLHYQRLQRVLFSGDYSLPAALALQPSDGASPWLTASALVRGQGKTEGLHQRWLPLNRRVASLMADVDGRQLLGRRSKQQAEDAATIRLSILKPALLQLVQGAPEKLQFDDKRIEPWLAELDRCIDNWFFELLFAGTEAEDEAARQAFVHRCLAEAAVVLQRAEHGLPIPSARRYRALSKAQAVFYGGRKKHYAQFFSSPTLAQEVKADASQSNPG